jgi:FkbM family methyltransferase
MKTFLFSVLNKIINLISGKGLGNINVLSKIYYIIYNYLNPKKIILIRFKNKKLFVNSNDPVITPSLFLNGTYEPFETKIFMNLIKENDILLDIGANIGYYSIIAASIIKKGKIYAFEPEPHNYDLLTRNIKINGYNNIIPVQKVVSNFNGKVKMYIDNKNTGSHSLSQENVANLKNYLEVNSIKLDDYLEGINQRKVDIIKMDVQGAESQVIDGLTKTLHHNTSIKIIMEFWPKGLINMEINPIKFLQKIKTLGFKIAVLDEANEKIIKLSIAEIVESCKKKQNGKDHINLLLTKSDIHN